MLWNNDQSNPPIGGLLLGTSPHIACSGLAALRMPTWQPQLSHHKTPQKITLGEIRSAGVRGLLICYSAYRCSHWIAISGDRWPGDVRLSDIEPSFTCQACGRKSADVRPNFNWEPEVRASRQRNR